MRRSLAPAALRLFVAAFTVSCFLPASARAQGAMTNGANHPGTIATSGQIDTWTFSASAGDNLTLSIAEVEPTVSFNPWIRVFAPDASPVANAFGSLAAQINNVVAPQTGTYTVLVSAHSGFPAGTGSYVPHTTLTGNRAVNDPTATNVALAVLHGASTLPESGQIAVMPAFAAAWSDEEIADVSNYVIARFGAKPSSITADDVRKLREMH